VRGGGGPPTLQASPEVAFQGWRRANEVFWTFAVAVDGEFIPDFGRGERFATLVPALDVNIDGGV